MSRLWYLRRAVPWAVLLGCAAAAAGTGLLVGRWPESALMLLPVTLACCVTGATFLFDERALAVVAVTPRGGAWRRSLLACVAMAPLLVWLAVIATDPGGRGLATDDWGLVGLAAVLVGVAAAGLLSSRDVAGPGTVLAPWVVLVVCAPVVVSMFLDVDQIYPHEAMGSALRAFWVVVATAAALVVVATARHGVRR